VTADRDWCGASLLVAAFVLLVAALLGALRGLPGPFDAWAVIAGIVLLALAAWALGRAAVRASRRAWGAAAAAAGLALAYALAPALLPALGARAQRGEGADPFGDAVAASSQPAPAGRAR